MAAGARVVVHTRDALLAERKEILAMSDGHMRQIIRKEVKSTRNLYWNLLDSVEFTSILTSFFFRVSQQSTLKFYEKC
jgi:hypothetical protein